jgi:DNA-directed RNA polymerase subunit N (RpoN/RPB10)
MHESLYRFYCLRCGREIAEEEYETYSGMCKERHEIEINELDFYDDYGEK